MFTKEVLMIEFKGELTGQCKEYVLKTERKNSLIGGAAVAVVFSTFTIILALFYDLRYLAAVPLLCLFAIPFAIPPSKKSYGNILPTQVIIDVEEGLTSKGENFSLDNDLENVTKVIDFGEGYHICFSNRNNRFVCQKSLITQGTLEEFEELFKDVLVKETK